LKTEATTLKELGQEYERTAQLQQFFIDKCRADIKRAEKSGDSDAVRRLKQNLHKFYEIKEELTRTAHQLKNYYKGEN
jgi:flagellin-specific chaperone FliS